MFEIFKFWKPESTPNLTSPISDRPRPDFTVPTPSSGSRMEQMSGDMRDFFLCHASEDKMDIVRPLAEALKQAELSFWLDEAEIKVGDNIPKKISEGLSKSRYMVVIFGSTFLQKSFPQTELTSSLFSQASKGNIEVLPIWACSEEAKEQILSKYHLLQPISSLVWNGNASQIVKALLLRLRPDAKPVERVCFVSSEYPPHVFGGLGVHVDRLTAALGQHLQVDVVLPSTNEPYHLPSSQVQLYPLSKAEAFYDDPISWFRFSQLAAHRIIGMANEFRPSVLHCHDWVTVLAGLKSRWYLDIPLIFHLHLPNRRPLCASIENLGLICADLVTVNSEAMYSEVTDRHLTLRRPIAIIKNGVDLELFHPCEDGSHEEDYILFVGRLVEQKGVWYLIRAFCYIAQKFPNVSLKIVGSGPLRPELETLCSTLELSHKVEFLGWKTGRELSDLYQKSLVVAIPSIYEPFGMTALEGLACRRPVVASKIGGLKEIIQHKNTGFLAEPRDELDLAQWLMTLLSNSGLRNDIAHKGYDHIHSGGYTWPQIARQFLQLYERLQEESPDKDIPSKAWEFQSQILDLAREMSPDLRNEENNVLNELFNWMV